MTIRESSLLPTNKKGGDPFYNTEFNQMARAANVVNTVRPGTFAASIFTGDYQNNASFPAWTQHIVEVIRRKTGDDAADESDNSSNSSYGADLCEKKFPFFELLAGNIIQITTPYDEHNVRSSWTMEAELDLTFVIRESGSSGSSSRSSSHSSSSTTSTQIGRAHV